MMQTQLTPQQLSAILSAPSTRDALAEAEALRGCERSTLLHELAEAELAAAVQGDELSARVAALRAAYVPLAAKADAAREALRGAEAQGFAVGLSTEARVNALRGKLLPLGGTALAAARGALALERRICEGTLGWRTFTEWTAGGNATRCEPSPGNAAASALIAAINAALLELDELERDGGRTPAAIDARLAEIREEIEALKAGAPTPRRAPYINPHDDERGRRTVAATVRR